MTEMLTTPGATVPETAPDATRRTPARALLTCGVVAGPLYVVVALLQVLVRDGFDLSRHPLSLLSLGDWGWIQITNFVVGGLLAIGFAIGLGRVLPPGRGGTWAPLLVGGYGLGLIAGGAFVADPGLGFPPGTPDGIPDHFSWHGLLHAFAPPLASLSLIAACFVLVRRFVGLRQRGWATYCAITGVACLALAVWPDPQTVSIRLAVLILISWAWVSALAVSLLAEPAVTINYERKAR
jgi:Protein of unknown function (DUF998)